MKKYTFYIGCNDKDSKTQIVSHEKARHIVESIFIDVMDGCTIYDGQGIYKHENGQKVNENTFIVECFDCAEKDVYFVAEYLKKALNQESIAVNVTEINSMFI